MRSKILVMVAVGLLAGSMAVQASVTPTNLIVLPDGEEVLDATTNLIWLRNWASNGVGVAGLLDWQGAGTWASGLTTSGVAAGTWALPDITQFETLFGEVGDLTQVTQFTNVVTTLPEIPYFWTSTQLDSAHSVIFYPTDGTQGVDNNGNGAFPVAVRLNQGSVPEPATLSLLGIGLAGLGIARRQKARPV